MTGAQASALYGEVGIIARKFARVHLVLRRDQEDLQQEAMLGLLAREHPERDMGIAKRRMLDYLRRETHGRSAMPGFPDQLTEAADPATTAATEASLDLLMLFQCAIARLEKGLGIELEDCRHRYIKYGYSRGRQRVHCKKCGRTFNTRRQ